MGTFSVATGEVQRLAGDISNGANGIRQELETLDSKVKVLRESWSGSAKEAYDEAQREWTASLVELHQTLEQIAAGTLQVASTYTDGDRASAQRFAL